MTRRQLLHAIAALPALALSPGRAVSQTPKFSSYPFTLGVASGEPDPHGVVLWTRLAPKPLEGGGMPNRDVAVGWQVASDEKMSQVVAKGEVAAKPELGHSVHVEVEGLEPDRFYYYQFKSGSEVTPVARTRTAPAAGVTLDRLRFAFASCQHYETGYYTAYEHMAKEDLDLIVHLGDYIYEREGLEGRTRKHSGPEITTLEHYRNRHAQYKTDEHLQAAHRLCPWLVTWDDHEVDNNYADAISEELDVSTDELLTRRAHAYQGYFEHMPLRLFSRPVGHDMQLYRRVPFGGLADFTVLDTRQYRTDQPCNDTSGPECEGVFDPTATLLGPQQEKWFYQKLAESPSIWNVVAQQVMVARMDRKPGPEGVFSADQWGAYRESLNRFMSFLERRKPSNPVVLTGDIHTNWVNDLISDFNHPEHASVVGTEFVGTSITSGGDGEQRVELMEGMQTENPWLKFYNAERGYVSCTVTPKEWRSDYQVVEYVSRPGAPLVTRASFRVEAGRPGAERV